ncbi:MAG: glycosyltransferase family 2 protein [Candidatus Cryptobacteroides sp.]
MAIDLISNPIKVSVIIPMYNVAKFLHRSVQSLYGQTLSGIELVFVDDCSRDDTLDELRKLVCDQEGISIKVLTHSENLGVAAARNTGLQNASGEFIYYVDADDYVESDTLEVLYNAAVQSDAGVVGCEWYLSFAKNERHMVQPDVKDGRDAFCKMAKGVMRTFLCIFMVRKSVYDNNGLSFIPRQDMCEDMMLMMKVMLLSSKVIIVHKALYHYVQTNNYSLTKSYKKAYSQISSNIYEVERFLHSTDNAYLTEYIQYLKLTLKQPFLVSPDKEDYIFWQNWFPESNQYAGKNNLCSWRANMLQRAAEKKYYWLLRLHYCLVMKVVYGLIYN